MTDRATFLRLGTGLLSSILLSACALQGGNSTVLSSLPPCTIEGTIFDDPKLSYAQWIEAYHGTVDKVVEAHVRVLKDPGVSALACTAEDSRSLLRPTEDLSALAKKLPPWKTEEAIASLSEMDIGSVLLEFLRTYECALAEDDYFLAILLPSRQGTMDRGDHNRQVDEARGTIEKELTTARGALNRTLALLGGLDRLHPLVAEFTCLERASLDARNVLSLAAEASTCLPRIWDARTSLRNP